MGVRRPRNQRGFWSPLRISGDEVSQAALDWIASAETKADQRRRELAVRDLRCSREIAGRLRRGELPFGPMRPLVIDKRIVVDLSPLDAILARALHFRIRACIAAEPRRELASCLSPTDSRGAVFRLLDVAARVAEREGASGILLFDGADCFSSLSPRAAIDRLEAVVGETAAVRALRALYEEINRHPDFRGCHAGPATSPLLVEIALMPLDVVLGEPDDLIRFADNWARVVPASELPELRDNVEHAFAEFRARERSTLRPHEWQQVVWRPQQGFEGEIAFMGIRFAGHERHVPARKLTEVREEMEGRRLSGDSTQYAKSILSHYRPLLTESGLRKLEAVLRSRTMTSGAITSGVANQGSPAGSNRNAPRSTRRRAPGSGAVIVRKSLAQDASCSSSRCEGGIWRFGATADLLTTVEAIAVSFLETSNHPGWYRRHLLYSGGGHARVLARVAADYSAEHEHSLRRAWPLRIDPAERMPGWCGEHMRHAVRADVMIDHFGREFGVHPERLDVADVYAVATITLAPCWVLWAASLVLFARTEGLIDSHALRGVVSAIKYTPPELRVPERHALFHRGADPLVTSAALERYGADPTFASPASAQRQIATRLRRLARERDRVGVRDLMRRLQRTPR